MAPKSLVILCDGTGMDGLRVDPASDSDGGNKQPLYATNVLRLSHAIRPARSLDGQTQIVYYQTGVGSLADFKGDEPWFDSIVQGFGNTVASKIRDAYAFIALNYMPGDEIYIFGFSRGAYTARKVAGLINRIGLLRREEMINFFRIWLELVDDSKPGPPWPTDPIPIQCVGVWDTVDSVYQGLSPVLDALSIKDTSLPPNIKVALHAVSLQENREKFMCTLWSVDPGQTPPPGQIFKQQFFPGAHADVGGGYKRHELADLALFWMVGEISSLIDLDLDYVETLRQPKPDADWGATQPHNAYEESGDLGYIYGVETRLAGGQIFSNSNLHTSLEYAPTNLKDPRYMITLKDLQNKFGPQWQPPYTPRNAFEEKCKEDWNNPIRTKPALRAVETPEHFTHLVHKLGKKKPASAECD